jgi:hypothetical protein
MSDTKSSHATYMVVISGDAGYVVGPNGKPVATIGTMTIERGNLAALLVSDATESFSVTARLKRLAQ